MSLSSRVTAIPPATPTTPPPAAIAMWVTFSLDSACTVTPRAVPVLKPSVPLALPSSTPPSPVPRADASTVAPLPIHALVALVSDSTPTEAPMPATPKPPAPETTSTLLSSRANTPTSPPAKTVAPSPIQALVWLSITGTFTVPPTPATPPPTATPMNSRFSAACASTTTSSFA